MDEHNNIILSKTQDNKTMVYIKSMPLLFIMDLKNNNCHTLVGNTAEYIFEKLSITSLNNKINMTNKENILLRNIEYFYEKMNTSNSEFIEVFARFEEWIETLNSKLSK